MALPKFTCQREFLVSSVSISSICAYITLAFAITFNEIELFSLTDSSKSGGGKMITTDNKALNIGALVRNLDYQTDGLWG